MIKRAKILIIDDDRDILQSLQNSLELPKIELEIITADRGMKGLQAAKQLKPDVVILDLQMPDVDGFEVLDEIKADPMLSHVKVIMLTARDNSKNMWEGIDRQLDDFIPKPFDLEELEARIYAQLMDSLPPQH